jgi:hypothetical protein
VSLEDGLDEKVRYLGRQRGGKPGRMPTPEAAGRCARRLHPVAKRPDVGPDPRDERFGKSSCAFRPASQASFRLPCGVVLTGAYRDLFTAIATSAAALTGLLFVVITVAERRNPSSLPHVVQQVRASAALLAFGNALAVSLFSLVPGTHVGYPAVVVGVIGVFFSVAATRSLIASPSTGHWRGRHLPLTVWLLVIFAVQLGAGIELLIHPRTGPLGLISDVLVLSLIIGIARAWELVGGRGTGVIASLTLLIDDRHIPSAARSDPPEPTDTEEGETPSLRPEADKSQ